MSQAGSRAGQNLQGRASGLVPDSPQGWGFPACPDPAGFCKPSVEVSLDGGGYRPRPSLAGCPGLEEGEGEDYKNSGSTEPGGSTR